MRNTHAANDNHVTTRRRPFATSSGDAPGDATPAKVSHGLEDWGGREGVTHAAFVLRQGIWGVVGGHTRAQRQPRLRETEGGVFVASNVCLRTVEGTTCDPESAR